MSEQRSAEWFAERCGKVTASRIADLAAKIKSGWGASRANYMGELIAQRLTGVVQNGYSNAAMQWGVDTEAEAITAYEFYSGVTVEKVGFIEHPTIPMAGASPDGHVGPDGSLELKCPNTSTHIETLLGSTIPDKYLLQMQFQMACSGRKWSDFVSYDPRMPEELKLLVARVPRNDEQIGLIEALVKEFQVEIDAKIKKLSALKLSLPEAA